MAALLERFKQLVKDNDSALMFCFSDAKGNTSETLTRGELDQSARRIAALLQKQGLNPGDRAMLVFSFSLDVVPAVLGCFYAGVIPCPVSPPNPAQLKKELTRFEDLAQDSGCKVVLTNSEYSRYRSLANVSSPLLTRGTLWRSLSWLKTDGKLPEPIDECHQPDPDDIAFLQYTSGSTSTPKGVMISFNNLIAQLNFVQQRCKIDESSRLVAWIPYYHDHCLVAGILNMMYRGGVLYLMSPLTFLSKPAVWFDVLTRVKATGTAAPDFAFSYAVRKTTVEQRQQWDLSSIDIFQSGGEPVQADSVNKFFDAFAVAGLRADTFSPGYGMAEHVLAISNKVGTCKQISIDRRQYEQANRVVLSDGPDSQALVGNGKPLDGVQIEIVDPGTGQQLAENDVGEIWIDSDSKALGYWNKPDLNETEFNARIAGDPSDRRYLRSGDLGFFYEDELFVAGRIKDTIILRGRNIHPQDVEVIVSDAHPSIRPGRSVAFSHSLKGESEHLAVITELKQKQIQPAQAQQIADHLRRQITSTLAVSCRTLVFVSPNTISKTTSGKHQRLKTRNDFQNQSIANRILWQNTLAEEDPKIEVGSTPEQLTEQIILERLVAHVAAIEVRPEEDIDADAPLSDFALDSLAIMGLVLEMTTWSGRDVSHEAFVKSGSLRGAARTLLQADHQRHNDNQAPSSTTDTLVSHSIIGDQRTENLSADTIADTTQHYPLNPSQAWMFEPDPKEPHGWTIGGMLHAIQPVDVELLQHALDLIVDHHEALRMRLEQTPEGWQQRIDPTCSTKVECVDLYNLSGTSLRNEVERVVAERQHSMNCVHGPAIQVSVLRVDDTEIERLLFLVHHIAVDAYSCELVVTDLIRTYEQLLHDQPVTLVKPSVSYGEWMNKLISMASSDQVMASADYFLNMPTVQPLALDNPQGSNTDGNYTAESFMLSHAHSEKLMRDIPNATGLSTAMLLLTGLGYALRKHLDVTTHRLELVHHGRKDAIENYDLSHTCGWMSINCPFTLEINTAINPLEQALAIQAKIAELPRHGLDYSLLTFLHPDQDFSQRLRNTTRPEIKFMWFGQAQGRLQALANRYPLAQETVGTSFDKDRSTHYLKYFYGTVHNGCIRLDVGSSKECYRDTTRQSLLSLWRKNIEALIDYCS